MPSKAGHLLWAMQKRETKEKSSRRARRHVASALFARYLLTYILCMKVQAGGRAAVRGLAQVF